MSRLSTVLFTASLASLALARTDLVGCTSTDVSSPAGASIAWYVPGTGELCDFLDCGGGTAPPKTTVPGCPLYSGTATYSPSYLAGYGAMSTSSAEATMSTSYGSASDTSASSAAVVPIESTMSTASSDTTESNTSLFNSAVGVTSYETASASAAFVSSVSSGMTTITSSPSAGAVGGNGTTVGSGSSGSGTGSGSGSGSGSNTNGTISSGSPSPITSNSGAMETARVWLGGSALLGLGAIVAAL